MTTSASAAAVVSELNVYPIKSARGIAVDRWDIDEFGFRLDRRWMVIRPDNSFMSQRKYPRMALISVQLVDDQLLLSAPGMEPLKVSTAPPAGQPLSVVVWDDTIRAVLAGQEAARWITEFLELPCRLVYLPADSVRPIDPVYALGGDRVGFADAYPILLISRESLDDLNRRLEEPIPMNRFRPNIVVTGADAYGEDRWKRFRIAGMEFFGVKPCARCVLTTVDQSTGLPGQEPLRTLAEYRRFGGKILFGQNVIHRGTGTLSIGDRLEVVE
jgi:uncharacterized protein YcbX